MPTPGENAVEAEPIRPARRRGHRPRVARRGERRPDRICAPSWVAAGRAGPAALSGIDEASRAGLIVGEPGGRRSQFAHALVRQTLLAALRAEGCEVLEKTDDSEYGKFGWVMDPEGNKVELWQPPPGE